MTYREQDWFFTFGQGHAHPNGYVQIFGTFTSARKEMLTRYGDKWAFQYSSAMIDDQIKEYNLYRVH